MGRSAAALLLTLVLGAFVAANADGEWKGDYEKEPKAKECRLGKPLRWSTYGCPKCKTEDGCIETKCSEGKADVKIKLSCLFGGRIGFVAMSYKYGGKDVCINNQKGYNKYDKEFKLYNLKCKELPKLRFIVQNKWWYNPKGKDLEIPDSCYDKCTKGKPCHTCVFKDIYIPKCKKECKTPEYPQPKPEKPQPEYPQPKPEKPQPEYPQPKPEKPQPQYPQPKPEKPQPEYPQPKPEKPQPEYPQPKPEKPQPEYPQPKPEKPQPEYPQPKPEKPQPEYPQPKPEKPQTEYPQPKPEKPQPEYPQPKPEKPQPEYPQPKPEKPQPQPK